MCRVLSCIPLNHNPICFCHQFGGDLSSPLILFHDYWLICPTCVYLFPSSFAPFIISLCVQSCASSSLMLPWWYPAKPGCQLSCFSPTWKFPFDISLVLRWRRLCGKNIFFLFNWSLFLIMQWNYTSIGSCRTKKWTNGSASARKPMAMQSAKMGGASGYISGAVDQTCCQGTKSPQGNRLSTHSRFRKFGKSLAELEETSSPPKTTLTAQSFSQRAWMPWPTSGPAFCSMLSPQSLCYRRYSCESWSNGTNLF